MSAVQAILDGKWRLAKEARAACIEGQWAAFVERTAPPKPALFGRGAHAKCVARASEMFAGPREVDFEIVPVWACTNEDETEPTNAWWRAHLLRVGDAAFGLAENGPFDADANPSIDAHVMGRARAFDVGNVVLSRSYAPGIALAHRDGELAVLAGRCLAVIETRDVQGAPLPQPTEVVQPFCQRVAPRVEGLTQEVLRAIAALSFDPEE